MPKEAVRATDAASLLEVQEQRWAAKDFVTVERLLEDFGTASVSDAARVDLLWNEKRLRMELAPEDQAAYFRQEYQQRYPDLATLIGRQSQLDLIVEHLNEAEDSVEFLPSSLAPNGTAHAETNGPFSPAGFSQLTVIGRGAFATVYRAKQLLPQRDVAIKLLHPDGERTPERHRRVMREAERLAKLRHVNIVEIYSVGSTGSQSYFTMPLLTEGTLRDRIAALRDDFRGIASLLISLAEAVEYAHSLGFLHCDIKPANVLLDRGRPLLADFGLAAVRNAAHEPAAPSTALASASTVVSGIGGTPEYMAPEQWSGDAGAVSSATDVYGLGALLFHLVTGTAPGTRQAFRPARGLRQAYPKAPRDLAAICDQCLSEEPSKRYQSARALQADLRRFLECQPVSARLRAPLPDAAYRLGKWFAREKVLASALAIVTVLLVGFSILQTITRRQTEIANESLREERTNQGIAIFNLANMARQFTSLGDAALQYAAAAETFQELGRQYPENDAYRILHAKTLSNLGSVLADVQSPEEGIAKLEQAIESFQQIRVTTENQRELSLALADAHSNVGQIQFLREHNLVAAEDAFRKAMALRVAEQERSPSDGQNGIAVAKSRNELAMVLAELHGVTPESKSLARESFHFFAALPETALAEHAVFGAYQASGTNLAHMLQADSELTEALQVYEQLEDRWRQLGGSRSQSMLNRQKHADMLSNRGLLERSMANDDDAIRSFRAGLQIYSEMDSQEGQNQGIQQNLLTVLNNLATAIEQRQRQNLSAESAAEARTYREKSIAIANQLLERLPNNDQVLARAAETYQGMGEHFSLAAQPAEALPHFAIAEELRWKCKIDSPDFVLETAGMSINYARTLTDAKSFENAAAAFSRAEAALKRLDENARKQAKFASLMYNLHDGQGTLAMNRLADASAAVDPSQGDPSQGHPSLAADPILSAAIAFYGEAIRVGEEAEKRSVFHAEDAALLTYTRLRRATAYQRASNLERALEDFQVALDRIAPETPEYPMVAIEVARLKILTNRIAEGIAGLDAVVNSAALGGQLQFEASTAYALAFGRLKRDADAAGSLPRETSDQCAERVIRCLNQASALGLFTDAAEAAKLLDHPDLAALSELESFIRFRDEALAGSTAIP